MVKRPHGPSRPPALAWLPVLAPALLLAGCARHAAPPAAPPDAPPAVAPLQPLAVRPSTLAGAQALDVTRLAAACPALLARPDPSGLTRPADWAPACAAARAGTAAGPFLDAHFRPVRRGDGRGLVTGYFVPAIPGSEVAQPGLVPVLGPPAGLSCTAEAPCPPRAAIEAGALAGRAPILGWADPVDLFFLQVQGSGVLRLPGGRALNLAFAGSNGQPYVAIGQLLRGEGKLPPGAGMAGIRAWMAANPADARALMARNPRYVFFRAVPPGQPFPVGALGTPLAARQDAAVDPALVPPGALVHLSTRVGGQPFAGLLLASDRGAAIRGANRIDLYLGEGAGAGRLAGSLEAPGELVLLLPVAAAERMAR